MFRCLQFNFNNSLQIIVSLLLGWFVFGQFWNSFISLCNVKKDSPRIIDHCNCLRKHCSPCNLISQSDNITEKRNFDAVKQEFRSDRFEPRSLFDDETNRWRLLTKKFHYEMINQEPRVGINGMWREELLEVDSKASDFLRDYERDSKMNMVQRKWDLLDLYTHYGPFHGMNYVASYVDKTSGRRRSLEMRRPFMPGIPRLVSIDHETDEEVVNIVCPISKVSNRLNKFMDRYERNILRDPQSSPIRLLFVIFRPMDDNDPDKMESISHTVAVLKEFKKRNNGANIEYIFEKGDFSRAVGLHSGVMHVQKDEIILFLDVDLAIGSGFISRIRRNTIRGKRVIFPIMFSQYDPDVIDEAAALNDDIKASGPDKMSINQDTGFWIHYAYGVAAMHKSDYLKVGGFRLDIKGWGGEDVDLFQKMVADPDLEVMWMVDKELVHIYHSRGCDPKLASHQYAMCIGAWSETLGSRHQMASLYLNRYQRGS